MGIPRYIYLDDIGQLVPESFQDESGLVDSDEVMDFRQSFRVSRRESLDNMIQYQQ